MSSPPREVHEAVWKRRALGLAGLVLLAVVAFLLLARRPAIAPIQPPAAARFAPEQVARGKILAAAGNCASCHTVKGGEPFAGGLAIAPLRMGDVPEMDIEFIASSEVPVGLGEPCTTVVGPAIGNAIFAAVGARVRHLPIRPAAILQALPKAT